LLKVSACCFVWKCSNGHDDVNTECDGDA
jgi:hypothetical protein